MEPDLSAMTLNTQLMHKGEILASTELSEMCQSPPLDKRQLHPT